jgi:hypothetical protein
MSALVRVPYWQKIRAAVALQAFSIRIPAPDNAVDVLYASLASRYYLISSGASQWIAARGLRSIVLTVREFDQGWSTLDPREIIGVPAHTGQSDSYNWVLGAGDAMTVYIDRVGSAHSEDVWVNFQAPSSVNGLYGWVVFGAVWFDVEDVVSLT